MKNKSQKIKRQVQEAVIHFWSTRQKQVQEQADRGALDQGSRSAVTGGKQMDGFIQMLVKILENEGIENDCIFFNKSLELPGFFRPTKGWDMLVVSNDELIIALEVKSQVGPSFGNNFNNRVEEAIGTAKDIWTAYREGAFNKSVQPWLGYLFLLEDCEKSQKPVRVSEPHFKVFKEFNDASYAKRYEIFLRKLVRERLHSSCAFVMSNKKAGLKGKYTEQPNDLSVIQFIKSFYGKVGSFVKKI